MSELERKIIHKFRDSLKKEKLDFFDSFSADTKLEYAFMLLEYDINHFYVDSNHEYLLGTIPFLYQIRNSDRLEQEKFYEKLQILRIQIKDMLYQKKNLKETNYSNYKVLKKILGKLEVLSLSLIQNMDKKYDKNKADLLRYFVFSIKNIHVVERMIEKFPYQFTGLDEKSFQLICEILSSYIDKVKVYSAKEKMEDFNDVIYFNQIIELILNSKNIHFSIKELKTMDSILSCAMEYNGYQNKERYCYFINKWREVLYDMINQSILKKEGVNTYSVDDLLYQYNMDKSFSVGVLKEANFYLKKSVLAKRKNEKRNIFTIDGDGALELDDGFSCTKENGIYHLGIHIANPFSIIESDGLVFDEATKRTVSVYTNPVFPLFPSSLTNQLFSLNQKSYRSCFSLYVDIDLENKSIINTKIKTDSNYVYYNDTYTRCNEVMQSQSDNGPYLEALNLVQDLIPFLTSFFHTDDIYALLNRQESNITLTNITGQTSSEKMVETLMIFCNMMIAKMANDAGIPFLYRNHELSKIEINDLNYFRDLLKREQDNAFYLNEINVLKGLYPKSYYGLENKGHFGLGVSNYCHITSPIRRVVDDYNMLMIQKCILNKSSDKEMYQYELKLREIANYVNQKRILLENFTQDYGSLQRKLFK